MFEPMQKFLARAAGSYGMQRQVEAAQVCQAYRAVIDQFFDDPQLVKTYLKAGHFKKGVFVVIVKTPAWAQEVMIRKHKIIEKMNERLQKSLVKNLRTQLCAH